MRSDIMEGSRIRVYLFAKQCDESRVGVHPMPSAWKTSGWMRKLS